MKRLAARKLAQKLVGEGLRYPEISRKLYEAGYRSQRTQGPLSGAGISALLNKSARKKKKRSPVVATAKKRSPVVAGSSTRLNAVRTILEIRDMVAEDRIALLHLLLG